MVANTYFFIVISIYFLILVITSRYLGVLSLTNMEKIRGVFLEKYLGFQQVFNNKNFYPITNILLI